MKNILTCLFLFMCSMAAHAEGVWVGVVHDDGVIAPFALYRDGVWKEVWQVPYMFDEKNKEYFSKYHLPMPGDPADLSGKMVLQSTSLDNTPSEWLANGELPMTWYLLAEGHHYESKVLRQYEQECDIHWGIALKDYNNLNDDKTSRFATSKEVDGSLFQDADMKSKEVQSILEQIFILSKEREKRQWSKYQTAEQCQNTFLQAAYTSEANHPGSSYTEYYKRLAAICPQLFSGKKDVRTVHSLVNVGVKEAVLKGGSRLYHISSTLRFPEPSQKQLKEHTYTVFSHVEYDGWFLVDKAKEVHRLSGCGESLQCDCVKGMYQAFPSGVIQIQNKMFVVGSEGCYFGKYVIYEVKEDKLVKVLEREQGGC